jgi:hypothetical protein
MRPAEQNQRDVGLGGVEALGYFGLRHRSSQCPDLGHLFAGQKLLEERDETGVDGVLFVEPIIRPFEVRGGGIGLHAIDVINDGKSVGIWHERQSDNSVEVNGLASAASPEAYLRISSRIDARFEYLAIASLWAVSSHSEAIQTSNATDVADFVGFAKSGDGDASPFFDVHDMGSRGRDAHVIAPSRAHQGD